MATLNAKWRRFGHDFRAVKTPRRWAAFDRAAVRDHAVVAAMFAEWTAFLGKNPSATRAVASFQRFAPRLARIERIGRGYNRRMDAQNVLSCGSSW
jgi:hypothetical protein